MNVLEPAVAQRAQARALAAAGLRRRAAPHSEIPARLLLVDVERQRLIRLEAGEVSAEWRVSTASAGIGGRAGSHRTPDGWHRIAEMIGEGAEEGAEFRSREPTGERLRMYWREYDGQTHLRLSTSRDLVRGVALLVIGENLIGGQLGEPDNVTIRPGRTVTAGLRASF